jgi:hypothetical protein
MKGRRCKLVIGFLLPLLDILLVCFTTDLEHGHIAIPWPISVVILKVKIYFKALYYVQIQLFLLQEHL